MKWREIESGRRLLRRCMRSENAKVTNWLVPAFDRHWPDNLPLVDGRWCFRISSPFNLRRLVQENEVKRNVKYKVEAFTGMEIEKIKIYVEGVRSID